jgi:hypothetical protein
VVSRGQADVDFSICRADRAAVASDVVGAAGQSDAVQDERRLPSGNPLPDGILDLAKPSPRLLQARTRWNADMQAHLSGIDIREEVLPDERQQQCGRIVHQHPDRQPEPAQRQCIERLSQRSQDGDRGEDRKRDGDDDDERAPPAPQKQQDHQARQTGRDHRFAHHPIDGGLHEDGLIQQQIQPDIRGQQGADLRQFSFDAIDHIERGGPAVFQDREQDGGFAVHAHHARRDAAAVPHVGHVAHVDRRAVDDFDRQVVEAVDQRRAVVQAHKVVPRAHLGVPGR